jgi:hypothetical protein
VTVPGSLLPLLFLSPSTFTCLYELISWRLPGGSFWDIDQKRSSGHSGEDLVLGFLNENLQVWYLPLNAVRVMFCEVGLWLARVAC